MTLGESITGKSTRTNGYASTKRQSALYTNNPSWNDSRSDLSLPNGDTPSQPRYPHIKDLQAKAELAIKNVDPRIPIKSLLANAEQSAAQVGANVSFKRPDRAYVEYLIGTELLLHTIPEHKDFPSVIGGRQEWQQRYRSLCKVSELIW
ncbi:ubiquitin-specific protease doa4 [Lecanora helva]